jgi:hypothetical protein
MQDAQDQAPQFNGTGQEQIHSSFWLKGLGMGFTGISVGIVLGVTMKETTLNDMDLFSADDDETNTLLLTTILPVLALGTLGIAVSGPMSARFGSDMLQEMSKDIDPKEAARSCLTNCGLMLALFLTMILAAWQQDVSFDTRFAIMYRLLNVLAAESAIRGLVVSILVTLYMEPLDSEAAMQFACDNLQYLGECNTSMISCIVYFVNVLIVWEFGVDGIWVGILVSVCLGYSLIRMFVVFQYLSAWRNPQLSNEERAMRKERSDRLAKAGLKVNK